jgi:hypothetical protein
VLNNNGPLGDLDIDSDIAVGELEKKRKKRRDPEYSVRDLFTALAL